jgi:protein required for attachment to host cells
MNSMRLPEGAWVVVCDGRKALFLENAGDAEFPNLKTREADKAEASATSDLGTDSPGRVYQSVGERRSAVEQTDWHDKAEEEFLTDLVKRLDAAIEAKTMTHLVVVAPPRALGMMRHAYTDRLRGAIHAEIDKDLTALPLHEIERHLVGDRPNR